MSRRGTVAIEEAFITPATAWLLKCTQSILTPGDDNEGALQADTNRLLDIHGEHLASMA